MEVANKGLIAHLLSGEIEVNAGSASNDGFMTSFAR